MLLLFWQGPGGALGPPDISEQPQSQAVPAGTSVILSVTASGGALTYQWYTGASGDTTNAIAGETNSTLNISPSVDTNFWVRVTNAAGDTDSDTATISIRGGGGGRKRRGRRIRFADFEERDEREREIAEAIRASGMVVVKGKPLPINEPQPDIALEAEAIATIQRADTAIAVTEQTLLEIKKRRGDEEALLLILLSLGRK